MLFCKKPFMVILREGISYPTGESKFLEKQAPQQKQEQGTQVPFQLMGSAARDPDSSSGHALPMGQFHHLDFST